MRIQNVLDVIRKMNESSDEITILKYENILIRMTCSPILFFGSILNFIISYIVLNEDLNISLINSIVLLGFYFLLEFVSTIMRSEEFKAHNISLIFAAVLIFSVIRFYHLIGNSVWTIAIILIMISMVRIKRSMLIIISGTIFLLGVYVWHKSYNFSMGTVYYLVQTILFGILFVITVGVHRIIINRVRKIHEQFEYIITSKNDLKMLNTELEEGIKEHINTENALKSSEHTFKAIFEGSSDAILIIRNDKFIDCNLATVEILGYASKQNIIGKSLWDICPYLQPDGQISKEKVLQIIQGAQNTKKAKFEWWIEKNDGVLLPVEIMMTLIVVNSEKVFHVLWRDMSERKQMESNLEYLSYRDQLTGLYNRRFYEEELKRLDTEINLPITIVMGDVNGLKLVNDSFGHVMGDNLLKKVSEVISLGCRAGDIIARLGGDEFVIILPKTNYFVAEQIIKRITNLSLSERVGFVDISISFGCYTKNNKEEKVEDIFKNAEDRMYKVKLFESPSMRSKTIKVIINTLLEKNINEERHSNRVSSLCKSMGEALGLSEYEIEELKSVGLIHDIGKIAIDENILNKSGKLTEDEWKEIKRHPEIGYRILSTSTEMSDMASYVLHHHERWDGKGYPKGLKGDEIPFVSRIISIADAYDAMTSERCYREALSEEAAIEELQKKSGIQFDPELVSVFLKKVLVRT